MVLALVAAPASGACRRNKTDGASPAASASGSGSVVASASAAASSTPLAFERFVTARAESDGRVTIAGVTRDRRVVLASAGEDLLLRSVRTLADDSRTPDELRATDDYDLALADDGLVLAHGRFEGHVGAFLMQPDQAPRRIAEDACVVAGGVAWIDREATGWRLRFYRRAPPLLDRTSEALPLPEGAEVHLSCGKSDVAVTARDGEQLTVVRSKPAAPSEQLTTSKPISLERDEDIEDELRDRHVLVRDDGSLLVLRVGDKQLATRVLPAASDVPAAWSKVGRRFDEDAEVLAVAAAPLQSGPAWMLASEPMGGKPCANGDPARHVVLHTITTNAADKASPDAGAPGAASSATASDAGADAHATAGADGLDRVRPIVELACGVDAIRAHVVPEGERARIWWTEPLVDESCQGRTDAGEPFARGLWVGAIVEAVSDAPGAKHATIIAESALRLTDGRWIAVVRKGGCAPYKSDGAGALAWAPTPK